MYSLILIPELIRDASLHRPDPSCSQDGAAHPAHTPKPRKEWAPVQRAERTALALHRFGNDDICEPVRAFESGLNLMKCSGLPNLSPWSLAMVLMS